VNSPRDVVAHVVDSAGQLTEVWIDAQVRGNAYEGQLFATSKSAKPYHWQNSARQLVRGLPGYARVSNRLHVDPFAIQSRILKWVALRDRAPAVLHAHFGPIASLISETASARSVPLVSSFYGYDASKHWTQTRRWTDRYRRLFEVTSAVIVEGPAMAQKLVALGCPESKLNIVRLPFANIDLQSIARSSPRRYSVIMAGRFVEKKGFELGIRAFSRIARSEDSLLVVGEGPLAADLHRVSVESGASDRIHFCTPMPLSRLADAMMNTRLAIFPSTRASDGDSEGGAPLTLTLAQAVGTPAVVSDHDDLPWSAAPGTPVFRQGDVDGLAALMRELLDDPAGAGRLASAQQAFVLKEHDREVLVLKREGIYDAVH
jgi:colanic acid/amylovoran/stewartan biosynthesis glycosyltransferase WcaL/AmsK/CpsK